MLDGEGRGQKQYWEPLVEEVDRERRVRVGVHLERGALSSRSSAISSAGIPVMVQDSNSTGLVGMHCSVQNAVFPCVSFF